MPTIGLNPATQHTLSTVRRALLAAPLLALLLAACGGGGERTSTTQVTETEPPPTATTTPPPQTTELRVYFLRDGKVQPVRRVVKKTAAVAGAALRELLRGPQADEEAQLGLETQVPEGASYRRLRAEGGVVSLELAGEWPRAGLGQLVYTLTQFPSVEAVEIGGRRYTRADFEDVTPAILVESPLPGETVRNPLRARGTANTFEATFEYDVEGPDGTVLAHDFVTATSGSGQRGTFELAAFFRFRGSGLGALVVYEISAKDGSRIHEVEIPLRLEG